MQKAHIILRYEGKDYSVKEEYDDDVDVEFLWLDGNWDCDCNRSLSIIRCCNPNFTEMDCGDEIELVSLFIGE